jgi:hypothetical protein
MEALLASRLPSALARYDARLALVFGLPETFTDADVPYAEACRLFGKCLSSLRRISSKGIRVVLVSKVELARNGYYSPMPAAENREGFFRHLARIADPALFLRRENGVWRWELRSGKSSARALEDDEWDAP